MLAASSFGLLLELCFGILTVTVPDPGLNGNLASGPFGFLIEYPCTTVLAQQWGQYKQKQSKGEAKSAQM